MKQTVTGRFRTWDDARHAQDALLQLGFTAGDIELPAHAPGVRAGIERLVASFFATDRHAGSMPHAPGDMVLLAVHVSDDAHAELASATLGAAHAVEVAMRSDPWSWAMPEDKATREHSALEELGLADLATAVWRRTITQPQSAQPAQSTHAPHQQGPAAAATEPGQPAAAPESAEAAALAAASAPGAGAVMGRAVEVPGAPVATQPARDVAPQIPDEFLEYEDDTPAHHRTLH